MASLSMEQKLLNKSFKTTIGPLAAAKEQYKYNKGNPNV